MVQVLMQDGKCANALFFLAVIICPKQFECVLASAAILTVTAKHHGEEMYGPPCGLSPDTLHIYCM